MDPSKNEFSRFRGDVTVRAFSKGIFFVSENKVTKTASVLVSSRWKKIMTVSKGWTVIPMILPL